MNNTFDQAAVVQALQARQQNKPPTVSSLLIMTSFCLVVLAIGLVFFIGSWNALKDGLASPGWTQTRGEIVSSRVSENRGSDNRDSTYSADVKYTYRVEGKEYTSYNVQFGNAADSNANITEGIVRRFPAGSLVTVYYAPDNPSNAVLIPGLSGGAFIGLGIGGVISLIGGGLLLWMVLYNVKHFVLPSLVKA